ncbi:MAG: HAD family hydrolase [Phycisphaerae bacterium]
MKIKAVIFDLDGTITRPFFDFDAIRIEMGLSREDGPILEAMAKMTPQKRAEVQQILDYHEQKAVDESQLNDGAKQTLEQLRNNGMKIGILTRNKTANAVLIAEKHGLKFDSIIDREDGPVKPDGFGVLELCRRFAVKPQETLMVGDYLFDIQCAKAARAIAVLLANHPRADEFAPLADYTVYNIDEILGIIKEKNNE